MSVDDAADGLTKDKLLFAVLQPLELVWLHHVWRVRVYCSDSTICCSKQDQLTVEWSRQFRSVRCTGEVCVLQVLVHLRQHVEDFLDLKIVLPEQEVALLAHSDEVDLCLVWSGVDDNLVDVLFTKNDCSTLADKT